MSNLYYAEWKQSEATRFVTGYHLALRQKDEELRQLKEDFKVAMASYRYLLNQGKL
jgi:hypothetical protein